MARRRQTDRLTTDRRSAPRSAYVETSVWGMTLENQPRALRSPTIQFLRQCRYGIFQSYISEVVLEEIGLAPAAVAARIRNEIDRLAPIVLELGDKADDLAQAYLDAGVIPANKQNDARHVAIATVAGLEIVVSWNHRHLANERKRALFNAVNRLAGYERELLIHTPFEVMQ